MQKQNDSSIWNRKIISKIERKRVSGYRYDLLWELYRSCLTHACMQACMRVSVRCTCELVSYIFEWGMGGVRRKSPLGNERCIWQEDGPLGSLMNYLPWSATLSLKKCTPGIRGWIQPERVTFKNETNPTTCHYIWLPVRKCHFWQFLASKIFNIWILS